MRRLALCLAVALCGAVAAPALAHEGNPDFESLVTAVDGAPGLKAEVLNGDDRLLLINESRSTVVVEGYDREPYARLRPDGTVEVNQRSAATYLNEDRFGEVPLPASVDERSSPEWKVVARNGRFEFHDHRMHWLAKSDPPQVREDRSERRRINEWSVPLRVGERGTGVVRGTLWWRGSGGGAPVAMFAALAGFALLGAGAAILVRRRRRRAEREPDEAW